MTAEGDYRNKVPVDDETSADLPLADHLNPPPAPGNLEGGMLGSEALDVHKELHESGFKRQFPPPVVDWAESSAGLIASMVTPENFRLLCLTFIAGEGLRGLLIRSRGEAVEAQVSKAAFLAKQLWAELNYEPDDEFAEAPRVSDGLSQPVLKGQSRSAALRAKQGQIRSDGERT